MRHFYSNGEVDNFAESIDILAVSRFCFNGSRCFSSRFFYLLPVSTFFSARKCNFNGKISVKHNEDQPTPLISVDPKKKINLSKERK